MKTCINRPWAKLGVGAVILSLAVQVASAAPQPESLSWRKIVNNQNIIPGTGTNVFNSYNQPSVNRSGFIVFRARSKGPNPVSGVYVRDMLIGSPAELIADRTTPVPWPNNTIYKPDDTLATFNEFPSIPRISMWTKTIATRGNSQPVWTYLLDGADTKAGTSGIYLNPGGQLITGVGLLGAVPQPAEPVVGVNYFSYMQVPGAIPGTKFDVFPGSPALAEDDVIVFKGNYTEDNVGKTGVFYRDCIGGGGLQPVELIANTSTVIPNLPPGVSNITFGSTAPPSAAGKFMVFAGYDNETTPTYGGIYIAELVPNPTLTTLVGIGDAVPGKTNATFTQFGEALSFDGRYLAFWASWGAEKKTLWLDCPTDGNADVLAYCREFFGDNYPVQVSVGQGIFVIDTQRALIYPIAETGDAYADFVYWNFSGKPPGVGGSEEEDGELPRWRSTSFLAVSGGPGNTYTVAFKARQGTLDPVENNYLNPVDGIYVGDHETLCKAMDTTMDGQLLDPAAPVGSKITALGIERESFRGSWLAVTASMLEPVSGESMAGIYATKVQTSLSKTNLIRGVYAGMLRSDKYGTNPISSFRVYGQGRFDGRICLNGQTYSVKGQLGVNGQATGKIQVPRRSIRMDSTKTSGPSIMGGKKSIEEVLALTVSGVNISGIRALEVTIIGQDQVVIGLATYLADLH